MDECFRRAPLTPWIVATSMGWHADRRPTAMPNNNSLHDLTRILFGGLPVRRALRRGACDRPPAGGGDGEDRALRPSPPVDLRRGRRPGQERMALAGPPDRTTVSDKAAPCPLDKINRQFHAPAPNGLWVPDFTYVATWAGFVYAAFVIDAYARRIVGWRVSRTAHADFVLDALEQALHARRPVHRGGLNPPRLILSRGWGAKMAPFNHRPRTILARGIYSFR